MLSPTKGNMWVGKFGDERNIFTNVFSQFKINKKMENLKKPVAPKSAATKTNGETVTSPTPTPTTPIETVTKPVETNDQILERLMLENEKMENEKMAMKTKQRAQMKSDYKPQNAVEFKTEGKSGYWIDTDGKIVERKITNADITAQGLLVYKSEKAITDFENGLESEKIQRAALDAQNAKKSQVDTLLANYVEHISFQNGKSSIDEKNAENAEWNKSLDAFKTVYVGGGLKTVLHVTQGATGRDVTKSGGNKTNAILELYKSGVTRAEIIARGYNDGTVGNVIVAYERQIGIRQ